MTNIIWVRRIVRWLSIALLVVATIFSWHNQVSRFDPEFRSPFDELHHFDYWWRIYKQKTVPEVYDRIQHESVAIWCGYGANLEVNPECKQAKSGPTLLENRASNYQPTFYVATAAMAWVLEVFMDTDNAFHLVKLANLVWGLISVVLVAWLALVLGVPIWLTAVLVFAVGQTPAFVFAAITLNQEMFVLLFCLMGLIWYVQRTAAANIRQFAIQTGLIAGICLTIKPTALLLPVAIVVAELLNFSQAGTVRLKRVFGFSLITLVVYALISFGCDLLRGVNPSDGRLRDYLLARGEHDFLTWASHVWTSFARSTASFHWRRLVDWDLPLLFMWFYPLVMTALVVVLIYLLIAKVKGFRPSLASRLFLGVIVACVTLPAALGVYLLFSDIPYFFQQRYYTAYILIAVVLAVAFIEGLVGESAFICYSKWRGVMRRRERHPS